MQTTEYSVWDWKVIDTSAERMIYHNNFLVYVSFHFSTRNFTTLNSWTQIGSLTMGNYAPENHTYINTNQKDLRLRITSNGQVQYFNTGSALSSPTIDVGIMYPKKSSLP